MFFKILVLLSFLIALIAILRNGRIIGKALFALDTNLQKIFKRLSSIMDELDAAGKFIGKSQSQLDDKIDAFTALLDRQMSYQRFQWNEFTTLARADMREARQAELSMAKQLKFALERLMGIALTSRQPAAPNDVIAMAKLDRRIEELEDLLSDNKPN